MLNIDELKLKRAELLPRWMTCKGFQPCHKIFLPLVASLNCDFSFAIHVFPTVYCTCLKVV